MASKAPEASLYSVLKLKPTCTSEEIANAWASFQKTASTNSIQYRTANAAHEILIDPVKREIYDEFQTFETIRDPIDSYCNFSKSFLTSKDVEITTGRFKSTNQNQTPVYLSLEDFYLGKKVDVKTKSTKPCDHCQNFVNIRACPECSMLLAPKMPICRTCNNLRQITIPHLCKVCNGAKYVYIDSKTVAIIKPGMVEGQKLRCANNVTEVILKQTPHSSFSRQGANLYVKKTISLTQALCGIRFVINHLDGRNILVTSPVGNVLYPGCRKVISKEGMPILNSADGKKGDLVIIFQVSIPNSIPKNTAREIEELLPERPTFNMPSNPETEEYTLTDFDPNFKLNGGVRYDEAYIDDKSNSNPSVQPKNQCTHQ